MINFNEFSNFINETLILHFFVSSNINEINNLSFPSSFAAL